MLTCARLPDSPRLAPVSLLGLFKVRLNTPREVEHASVACIESPFHPFGPDCLLLGYVGAWQDDGLYVPCQWPWRFHQDVRQPRRQ